MHYESYFIGDGIELQGLQGGDTNSDSVIIVLHGLAVYKEVHATEVSRLNSKGYFAVAFDAPHHGSRGDGWMDVLRHSQKYEQQQMMVANVLQQAQEVSELVKQFQNWGKKVCVCGISMGGYVTYALLRMKHKPELFAPFLANPDFRAGKYSSLPPGLLEQSGPADYIEKVYPSSLFMVNGGADTVVDATGAREFFGRLQKHYRHFPEKIEYHEYPESNHLMRPEDWFDAWDKFTARLEREGF
jgi:alpha-beta hydrolase superfamily lysophospholipase